MHFRVLEPPAAVRPWVSSGVQLDFDSAGTRPLPCHFPALVEGGLTVVRQGRFLVPGPSGAWTPLPRAFVSSAHALPMTLYRTPRLQCIGLRLQPAATLALLQGSPLGLPNGLADAADVFGRPWDDVVDRIEAAAAPAQGVGWLFAFVAERLAGDVHRQRLQRPWLLQQAALQQLEPAQAVGLGARQFERVFTGAFGLRPKLFQRVARVEALLRDALAARSSGADLALRHGFYDQSHMARDLRLLAGAPLQELVAAVRRQDTAHWALAVGTSRRERSA